MKHKSSPKPGVKCAEQNVSVWRTASEHIPEHRAHMAILTRLRLFPAHHPDDSLSGEQPFLDLPGKQENHFSDQIIGFDRFAGRQKMILKGLLGNPLKNCG